jgi:hypothetical protein
MWPPCGKGAQALMRNLIEYAAIDEKVEISIARQLATDN